MKTARVGSARIVKVDAYNVGVQQLREIDVTKKVGDKRVKTGEKKLEWVECGYYGHRLDHAAESALFVAMPEGEPITPQMVREAVSEIAALTRGAMK